VVDLNGQPIVGEEEQEAPPAAMVVGVPLRNVLRRLLHYAADLRSRKKHRLLWVIAPLAAAVYAASPPVLAALADVGSDDTLTSTCAGVLGWAMMFAHFNYCLSAIHDIARRRLQLEILGHMIGLTGGRHPSTSVGHFPMLAEDHAHNVYTWTAARQLVMATGERFLRRSQIFAGWYLLMVLGGVGTAWFIICTAEVDEALPVWVGLHVVVSLLVGALVLGIAMAAQHLNQLTQSQAVGLAILRRRALYEILELEEAEAEATEPWHRPALRQLRQYETAIRAADAEAEAEAAQAAFGIWGWGGGPSLTLLVVMAWLLAAGAGVAMLTRAPIGGSDSEPTGLYTAGRASNVLAGGATAPFESVGCESLAGDGSSSGDGDWAESAAQQALLAEVKAIGVALGSILNVERELSSILNATEATRLAVGHLATVLHETHPTVGTTLTLVSTAITLDADFDTIGSDTSAESYITFVSSFTSDVAALFSVSEDNITVNSLVAGSVVVDFTISTDESIASVSATDVVAVFSSTGVSIAGARTTTTIAAEDVTVTTVSSSVSETTRPAVSMDDSSFDGSASGSDSGV
jgi:hypothetical protein